MKLSVGFLFIFTLFISANQVALAKSEIKKYQYGHWDFAADFQFFQATANYSTSGGTFAGLISGNDYQNYLFDFSARTYLSRRWAVYSNMQVGAASSVSSGTSRTNSGVSHLLFGSDWIMYRGGFLLIPEFSFLYPMIRNNTDGDSVAFHEGVVQLSGLMNVQFDLKKIKINGFSGFIYRDEGRSSLLPYGVVIEIPMSNWVLGGDFKGYTSLGFDKDSDNTLARENYILNANGGAARYTGINPGLLELNGWMKINTVNKWTFQFGGGATLNGKSAAAGWNLFGGLSFSLDSRASDGPRSDLERFREETDDGVDQHLFVPEDRYNAPSPTEDQEEGTIEYKPLPTPTPVPVKKAPPRPSKKSIQDELDRTEMQIQLKSIKKKGKK